MLLFLCCVVHVRMGLMHNVHASECAYGQKTLCDGSFSLATELWTTGFVVCLGSHGGSWMMLPQLSEGRPCLAGSRTALTGYHRRNCGFCPALLKKKKELCQKRLGRVFSFSTDARTVCSGSLEAHIYNGAYLTLWHHQRACCVGLPGCSVRFVPLQHRQRVSQGTSEQHWALNAFTPAGAFSNIPLQQGKPAELRLWFCCTKARFFCRLQL